jgi:hypothetical protein
MEKKNTLLIGLVVVLSLLVVGLGGYVVYDKILNKDTVENENIEEANKEEKKIINLTDKEKIAINDLLNKNSFKATMSVISYYYFDPEDYNNYEKNQYNINLFETDQNRFIFTCNSESLGSTSIENSFQLFADFDVVNERATKLFGENLDLSKIDTEKHPTKTNYVDCKIPTGVGMLPIYKVNNLIYNEKTEVYTMSIDVLKPDSSEEVVGTAEFKYKNNQIDNTFKNSVYISFMYIKK